MTDGEQWFDAPIELYKEKVAQPVIWLGDDRHYFRAKKVFGDDVVKMNTFVHRPYELDNISYSGEFSEFFNSENYYRAKDICLKMMDRLDLYGFFNRIDRETYIHKLIIWTLKKVYYSRPEFLVAAEAPHDHAKYIIYEIFLFLKIPVYKFNQWIPAPLLFLQQMPTNKYVKKNFNTNSNFDKIIDDLITQYFKKILNSSTKLEPAYMKKQRLNLRFDYKILNFFKKDIKSNFLDFKHNVGMLLKGTYNPINPYRYGILLRLFNQFYRRYNLKKSLFNSIEFVDLNEKYVYFPLHFEPERTTNPDGGEYHDQFKALVKLREFVPKNINIVIKEHPSQIYVGNKGSRGRSPLFYQLIKNIKGVKFVDFNLNSIDLIKKSELVVSITGTVALEAAILGKKSITFGSVWYDKCPNIFLFEDLISYDEVINYKVSEANDILKNLIKIKNDYTIIAYQNASARRRFMSFKDEEFSTIQKMGIKLFIKSIILEN